MSGRRPARSSIAVVTSVGVAAVAGLLVTAAALDEDEQSVRDGATSTTSSRRTTTTLSREFPSGEEWSIATAVLPPPTSSSTTTTEPAPPPPSPPRPGEYTFREESGGETVDRLYKIEDRPPGEGEQRAPDEAQFLVTLETAGGSVTTITSWRPEAVLALQTIFRTPEVEGSCDWNPDLLQLRLPLADSGAWTYATSCTADFGGQQVQIDRTGDLRVAGQARIDIAGQEVAAWRLESKEVTRFRGAVERTDQEIRTWWFAPAYGLTVRERAEQRHTTREGTTDSTVARELVALRPV